MEFVKKYWVKASDYFGDNWYVYAGNCLGWSMLGKSLFSFMGPPWWIIGMLIGTLAGAFFCYKLTHMRDIEDKS